MENNYSVPSSSSTNSHMRDWSDRSMNSKYTGETDLFEQEQEEDDEANEDDSELVLVGDVKDRVALILDDIIDSSKSFISAANFLNKNGAKRVYIIATHGILSDSSLVELEQCNAVTGASAIFPTYI
jgi:ribose-phosphate pyrophosphokinase